MGKIQNFFDLTAWKKARKIVEVVYKITDRFPSDEKYGIISQLRRAACSITANIAEGFGRYHYGDKRKFYLQARGSLNEVQNFLILAKDLNYLKKEEIKKIWNLTKNTEKLLNGLIKATNKKR
jgi:four helix bundle protein